jgi:hypothetical protein
MSDFTSGNPATAGPNNDGSQSLARESKIGQVINGLVVTVALYGADAIGDFDFTPLPDALEPIAVAAAGVAIGLLSAWATKNRKRAIPLRRVS